MIKRDSPVFADPRGGPSDGSGTTEPGPRTSWAAPTRYPWRG